MAIEGFSRISWMSCRPSLSAKCAGATRSTLCGLPTICVGEVIMDLLAAPGAPACAKNRLVERRQTLPVLFTGYVEQIVMPGARDCPKGFRLGGGAVEIAA